MTTVMILASPVGSIQPVKGSTEIEAKCGHKVYAAPSTMAQVQDPSIDDRVMCIPCGLQELGDVDFELGALPGVREEISDEFGDVVAQAMFNRLGVKEVDPHAR